LRDEVITLLVAGHENHGNRTLVDVVSTGS
jgi:GTP1/Obg family GTP-binding protein